MTPASARADMRGRQLAWLCVTGQYAAASTLVLTAVRGPHSLWPWALALLFAVLGGGAGFAPVASLIAVQPLEAAGNPTPIRSLKVHIASSWYP